MAEILTREHFSFLLPAIPAITGTRLGSNSGGRPHYSCATCCPDNFHSNSRPLFKKLVPLQPPPSAPVRTSAPVLACAMAFILSWGSSGPCPPTGRKWRNSQGRPFLLLWGSVCCYYAPHLPSIFGIPVRITGSIILLFLLAEYIPERFMSATLRPSFLAGNLFRRMKNVSTSVPILHSGSFYSWQRYFSSASSAWEPTPSWTRRKHAMPKCPGKCWKQTSGSSPVRLRHSLLGQAPSLLLGKRCHHETRRR